MAFQVIPETPKLAEELNTRVESIIAARTLDVLTLMLLELRTHSELLARGLNIVDDIEQIREDIDTNLVSSTT